MTQKTHCPKVVIGAGATGALTAKLLAQEGEDVILVSRRGGPKPHPRIEHVALDAADASAFGPLARDASTIFNCAMPPYDRWPEEFPPIAESLLSVAKRVGADLVTMSNLYVYGAVSGPMHESLPLAAHTVKGRVRAKMWEDALASGVRALDVRASDFLGRGAVSIFTLMVLPGLLRGEPTSLPGDLDAPHSWTYILDAARTLVAASRFEGPWGRVFHVPSHVLSPRALSTQIATLAGAPAAEVTRMSPAELAALAAHDSIAREVIEMTYLFDSPCVLESATTERELKVVQTPLDSVLKDTLGTT